MCEEKYKHFTPFIVSTYGLLGKEETFLLKKMSSKLCEKWKNTNSDVFDFLKSHIGISVIHGTHNCIHSSRFNETKPYKLTTNNNIFCDNGSSL